MLPSRGDYINRWSTGRGGGFRRWRRECVWALSPSLILDVVYFPPLSFPRRELIALVHISIFHQWLSCCWIISFGCDFGCHDLSLFTWKTATKKNSLCSNTYVQTCLCSPTQRYPDGFFFYKKRRWSCNNNLRHKHTCCRHHDLNQGCQTHLSSGATYIPI